MGKIITACITILVGLTLLAVFAGNSFIGVSATETFSGSTFINGTETTYTTTTATTIYGLNEIDGAIAWFVILTALVIVIGLQVLGSGLADSSIRTIRTVTIYTAIWSLFSILPWSLIWAIPQFGAIIYITLTIAYAVGVFQKMGSDN